MRWPTAKELAKYTTRELLQKKLPDGRLGYAHLAPRQIYNQRERQGIRLTEEAKSRAYDERSKGGQVSSRERVRGAIAELEGAGYQVTKPLPHQPIIQIPREPGQHYRAAVVCCTHIGNVFQQLTYLHDFYRYAESLGIEEFWHAGDATDGPDSMHPAMRQEHWVNTFDRAVDVFCDLYPKPKNGITRLILGNHDEAWMKDPSGSDIGKAVAARRQDIQYVGRRAADVRVGGARIYIWHGSGPGAYARSYPLQKRIERFRPDQRPDILLAGNWHCPGHIPSYIGVEGFMLPSFEDTTPFITAIGRESVIGGLIFDFELGQTGIRDVSVKWRLYDTAIKGDHPK